ncbi:MAG: RecQ family ATP-dependent DNA helicase, partial [Chlorobiales bacterium]|nr:RecQ family ATP-dependent DNA helicase [Chlorobiales bacterium]
METDGVNNPVPVVDKDLLEQARAVLRKTFGYESFRNGQEQVILSLLKKRDTLAVMPTGQGKSICYQVPALMFPDGLTLVISPLIALMTDQVDSLRAIRYPAAALTSQMGFEESERIFAELRHERLKLLFIAPERLENKGFVDVLKTLKVNLVAVDEAHCISEWGYDFRPSYQKISYGIDRLEQEERPPLLALTATATREVLKDIAVHLCLREPYIYKGGFARENLSLSVFQVENKQGKLLDILRSVSGTAIVYAMSRKFAEETVHFLRHHQISAQCYHAGLGKTRRSEIQRQFFQNQCRVICATNAFGLGINKSDVRVVVHLEPPETLEAYFQEAGRAGRDGKRSYAVMLVSPSDVERQRYLIENSHPLRSEIEACYSVLQEQYKQTGVDLVRLEQSMLFQKIIQLCGEKISRPKLSAVLDVLERYGILTDFTAEMENETLYVEANQNELREWVGRTGDPAQEKLFEQLLRTFGAACFGHEVRLNLREFSEKLAISSGQVRAIFQRWSAYGLVRFSSSDLIMVGLHNPENDPNQLPINWDVLGHRKKIALKKFDQIERYLFYDKCRRNYILDYF